MVLLVIDERRLWRFALSVLLLVRSDRSSLISFACALARMLLHARLESAYIAVVRSLPWQVSLSSGTTARSYA